MCRNKTTQTQKLLLHLYLSITCRLLLQHLVVSHLTAYGKSRSLTLLNRNTSSYSTENCSSSIITRTADAARTSEGFQSAFSTGKNASVEGDTADSPVGTTFWSNSAPLGLM